jgi:glycosyltransferase involved in cell wall biosynthesis
MTNAEQALRVLIDAHMVGAGETGNETYVANLIHHLPPLPAVQCAAAVTPRHAGGFTSAATQLPLRPPGDWLRLLYTLPGLCRQWRADLLHVTYIAPFWLPCPFVVTVHDVVFKRHPEFFSPRDRLLFATLLPSTLHGARAIVTLSQHARQEIVHFFPTVKHKVFVTHGAAGEHCRVVDDQPRLAEVRARYGIRPRFVLAVGNVQPRKNLVRLIKAFAICANQPELQLVIVGRAQWRSSTVHAAVQALGLEDRVRFTGYVPDADLVLLYNAAALFVYPSLYEGFGLPILEAMACGVPVVASGTSAMPEVAGAAALLVDPQQVEQIAHSMRRVLAEPDLAAMLRQRGLEQAARFEWGQTAQDTVAVYRTVLSGR